MRFKYGLNLWMLLLVLVWGKTVFVRERVTEEEPYRGGGTESVFPPPLFHPHPPPKKLFSWLSRKVVFTSQGEPENALHIIQAIIVL